MANLILNQDNIESRVKVFDFIEAFSILCVIFCHVTTTAGTGIFANVCLQFTTVVAVPLFLLVNGALIISIKPFEIKKHIRKTLFLIINLICWKCVYLVSIYFYYGKTMGVDSFSKFIKYLTSVNFPYIPVSHFWFLYSLIAIYTVVPLFVDAYKNNKKTYYFYLIIFIISFGIVEEYQAIAQTYSKLNNVNLINLRLIRDSAFPFSNKLSLIIFFLMGPVLYDNVIKYKKNKRMCILFLAGSILFFGLILMLKYYQVGALSGKWVRLTSDYRRLSSILFACFSFAFILNINFYNKGLNRFYSFISKRTMGIYASHMLFTTIISQMMLQFFSPSVLIHTVRSILVLGVSLLFCEIISYIPVINTSLGLTHNKSKMGN